MKTGICTIPLIPLRSESSERSEMISQILFGEMVEVLEENDSWSRVRILSDNYSGWCSRKMVQILPESVFKTLQNSLPVLTQYVLTPCSNNGDKNPQLFLPAGSRLYFLDPINGAFPIFKGTQNGISKLEQDVWSILPAFKTTYYSYSGPIQGDEIIRIASLFMNAPYLWGGKSILGIDCSGLVQVVFSILGFFLPRDACDQALLGELIPDLSKSLAGDLAFFSNPEGKIVHIGVLMGDGTIIHSSGCVRIDRMDQTGIYNESMGRYTHQLIFIKRIIPSFSNR